MKFLKNCSTVAAGVTILAVLLLCPFSETKGQKNDGISRLIAVTQMKAQTASDDAVRGAEDQRTLVKKYETLRAPGNGTAEASLQPGRLTAREAAREKGVLQQLDANARRAKEVVESMNRLAAEVDRKPGQLDGIGYLVATTQKYAQAANDEAFRAVEKQRRLVKTSIGAAIGSKSTDDNKETQQSARLTSREVAREKAVLDQLESNARRAAEVLESVKRLATEFDRARVNGGFGWDRISASGPGNSTKPDANVTADKKDRLAHPDLSIKEFLFPPTNDKALRVHVVNTGKAPSAACRLVLTLRKINGVAVGRTTHVNVPALEAGAEDWIYIDAKSLLPNNVSLKSTTFRLNVDATKIVPESNETNNEIWHNLDARSSSTYLFNSPENRSCRFQVGLIIEVNGQLNMTVNSNGETIKRVNDLLIPAFSEAVRKTCDVAIRDQHGIEGV